MLAGQGYRPSRLGPLVYVYQLPPQYNTQCAAALAAAPGLRCLAVPGLYC